MTPTLKNLITDIRSLALMYGTLDTMPTIKKKEFKELMAHVGTETILLSSTEREKIIEEVFVMWEVKD